MCRKLAEALATIRKRKNVPTAWEACERRCRRQDIHSLMRWEMSKSSERRTGTLGKLRTKLDRRRSRRARTVPRRPRSTAEGSEAARWAGHDAHEGHSSGSF
jgi:hypothetical protein